MKKIVMSLLIVCTMLFMSSASIACDCGCTSSIINEEVSCPQDCDCGCKKGDDCKCKQKVQCDKEKCCDKCKCGCKDVEKCNCAKKCDKSKWNEEKTLIDEIKNVSENVSNSCKSKCCKKSKKCKKAKKCKKGCPLKNIMEETDED